MQALHSWEMPERQWEAASGGDSAESDSNEEFDYDSIDAKQAAGLLLDTIVDLKLSGHISAKKACILAFYACKAGVATSDDLRRLGLDPTHQSGAYSRRFDDICGHPQEEGYFYVDTPINARNEGLRIKQALPTVPPHEHLVAHWLSNRETLQAAMREKAMPRVYYKHPVVSSAPQGAFVWPIALYLDGVRFTREDTVVGLWIVCLLTGKRFLSCILRKIDMCNCGCRGWCSLRPLLLLISWSLVALARGEYLPTGPDGSVLPEDRRAFSGDSLGFFAACLFIKGDWMEFAATLGFPTWSSVSHPCMLCDCSLETAYRLIGASPLGSPWNPRDLAWYFGACARCEIPVVLSDDDYRTVRATLHYDKRKQGSLGRALALELPALGLRAGDRLEPSASVPDIGEGFDASNPGSAIFWRIPDSVETHHRNPIFNEETGLGPEALLVDALHSGSSGVFKYFGQELNWALFKKNVWQVQDGTADGRLISNTNRLRGDLFDWYKMESALGRNHCRVQALTYHMLGSEAEPDLKLHAAETNGYLKFCGWLLDRYGDVLDHAELWRTAQSGLAKMQDMISENPEVFGDADCQVACLCARPLI